MIQNFWKVGLNVLFYWLTDKRFYAIKTEDTPIDVVRTSPNPNWDGLILNNPSLSVKNSISRTNFHKRTLRFRLEKLSRRNTCCSMLLKVGNTIIPIAPLA